MFDEHNIVQRFRRCVEILAVLWIVGALSWLTVVGVPAILSGNFALIISLFLAIAFTIFGVGALLGGAYLLVAMERRLRHVEALLSRVVVEAAQDNEEESSDEMAASAGVTSTPAE
ncbi:MAG: hypothetical protein P0Y66_02195 [Candidatus Kaistia colombiensis]|nr:MAG: hypothetical protein P0Y66_02195 [Kaistia sp.]